MFTALVSCLLSVNPAPAQDSSSPDALARLQRPDKWFVGGGQALLWAPPHPLFRDVPGFWDPPTWLEYKIDPGFTVTLLDGAAPLELKAADRVWNPSAYRVTYAVGGPAGPAGALSVVETRVCLPDDVLVSELAIANAGDAPVRLDAVVWTMPKKEGEASRIASAGVADGAAFYERRIGEEKDPAAARQVFTVALGADRAPTSHLIRFAQDSPTRPYWHYTPFFEEMAGAPRRLPDVVGPRGLAQKEEVAFLGLHYALEVPARGTARLRAMMAAAREGDAARRALAAARGLADPVAAARANWERFFAGVPAFACSDPYLQRYYGYRWYGLRLNLVSVNDPALRLPHPCVFEGINEGWFRHHISYSAHAHMLELRWAHDPAAAHGSLLNLLAVQNPEGEIPGGVDTREGPFRWRSLYHANWGRAVRDVHRLHPDPAFLAAVYDGLARYARYFQRERTAGKEDDADLAHLYDVLRQGETGQEYMSRYLFADPKADEWGPIRLKGVDATVYTYELQRSLAWMARELGKPADEAALWDALADQTRDAVRRRMWDPDREFFVDVHARRIWNEAKKDWDPRDPPESGDRSPSKDAVGYYPFLTDIAGPEHLAAIRLYLFSPKHFGSPWPVPSTSMDDAQFSALGHWKGKRTRCPWNGRAWLMTSSHVADALGRAATTLDRDLRPQAADLLHRYVRMLFLDRDPQRPSSYEYYNPLTAEPPYYRGTEDYMHSWIADLILRYVAGVQSQDGPSVAIDPLPMGLDHFTLDRVKIRGRWLKVAWRKPGLASRVDDLPEGLTVWVDGREVARRAGLERVEVGLGE